jgi:hypothetical protein
MKRIIIGVVSLVCCFAAIFGIKMLDLPGLITALLVILDIGLIMLIIIYLSAGPKAESVK